MSTQNQAEGFGALVPANEGREMVEGMDPRAAAIMEKFGEIVAAQLETKLPGLSIEKLRELAANANASAEVYTTKMGGGVKGAFEQVGGVAKAIIEEAPTAAKAVGTIAVEARIGHGWRQGPIKGIAHTIEAAIGTWHTREALKYGGKVVEGLADAYGAAKAA